MTDDRPDTPCPACETGLRGRYCHACGQDTLARPQPIREMLDTIAGEYSPVDGKWARTVAVLATRPGRLLETYRAGASALYVTPLKLFIGATALFLIVLNFGDVALYHYSWKVRGSAPPIVSLNAEREVVVTNAVEREDWLQRKIEPPVDQVITDALIAARDAASPADRPIFAFELRTNDEQPLIAARLSSWLTNVLWLLLPLYAGLLAPLFGRRRLFLEHVVFALWGHAMAFLLMVGLVAANAMGAMLQPSLLLVPYLGYMTVAAARYYGLRWHQALWRACLHTAGYLVLVLMPTALLIYLTVMDWDIFLAYLAA